MKNIRIKAVLLILISAVFALSSCDCFRVQNAFTYRYDGKYTGTDTLINVDGYYATLIGVSHSEKSVSFYRDGSLISHFTTNKIYYYNKDKPIFRKLESGLMIDSIKTWSIDEFGLYKIFNDTIKSQVFYNYGMGNLGFKEVWYKIINKDKLLIIKYDQIDKECNYCGEYLNKELQFYQAWRPDSTDNWLIDCLREKGAGK